MTYITKIEDKWYAFEGNARNNQVMSIGKDDPCQTGCRWIARWNDAGIKYVASASPTRKAAYQKAKRHGTYGGEV